MDQQTAKTSGAAIVTSLKKAGIDFVATLPDEKMLELIRTVEKDPGSNMCRCAVKKKASASAPAPISPARSTALIMQNAGFLNSCNALTTTSMQFQIPLCC